MILKTGKAQNVKELVDAVTSALTANGFTLHARIVESAGVHTHVSRNGIYTHMYAAIDAANVFAGQVGKFSGLGLTCSTGFDSAALWRLQPGGPVSTTSQSLAIAAPFSGAVSYRLFISANSVCLVLEPTIGIFQTLGFGALSSGQPYFFGPRPGHNPGLVTTNVVPTQAEFSAYAKASVDSFTGWLGTGNASKTTGYTGKNLASAAQASAAFPTFFDFLGGSTSAETGDTIPLPARLYVEREGGGWSVLGSIPDLFFTNKIGATAGNRAGEKLIIGANQYTLFPGFAVKHDPEPVVHAESALTQEIEGKVRIASPIFKPGHVSEPKTKKFAIWNSNFSDSVSITSVPVIESGLHVSLKPHILAPGASIEFELLVDEIGVPIVAADLIFSTPDPATNSKIYLDYSRVFVFSIAPDWSGGIEESTISASSVIESWSGKEQRASLVSKPRRVLGYTASTMSAAETSVAENMLVRASSEIVAVPYAPDSSRLNSPAISGTNTLYVDTSYRNFVPGGYAIVQLSDTRAELLKISAVSVDSITLVDDLEFDCASGSVVAPAMFARLDAEINSDQFSRDIGSYNFRFTEEV